MKSFSTAGQDALERGDAIVSAAFAIYCATPIFIWGGLAPIDLAGDTGTETYLPLGDRNLAQLTAGALGGTAQNVTLTLSGVDPEALALLDASEVQRAPVVVRRLIFDSAGRTLLDAYVFTRGRLDQLKTSEVIGGPASVLLMIETAARGLGRRGGRMRSDADQRLVNPTDGFFKNVSYAGEKALYWGGKKPSTIGQWGGGNASHTVGDGGAIGRRNDEL